MISNDALFPNHRMAMNLQCFPLEDFKSCFFLKSIILCFKIVSFSHYDMYRLYMYEFICLT